MYQILADKHPAQSEPSENHAVSNQYEDTLQYISGFLTNWTVRPAIRHGPMSGIGFCQISESSAELGETLDMLASLVATSDFEAEELVVYNASRLIPIDKNQLCQTN